MLIYIVTIKDFLPPLLVCNNNHCGIKASTVVLSMCCVFSLHYCEPIESVFIFLSLSKVELIKGNLQSVGLTLRLVQSTDGYAGHVIIETVAPNSPAAIADLQRGDRLIAIGGNYADVQYTWHLQRKPENRCGGFSSLPSFLFFYYYFFIFGCVGSSWLCAGYL